jgi:hypothetical protein
MARHRYVLTADLARQIAGFIRAGGFPHVAAEALGVPREVFEDWLRRGGEGRGPAVCGILFHEVLQAHAQARLTAEVSVLEDRPLDWLKSGPGRPSAGAPGWTAPARAAAAHRTDSEPLLDPQVQEFFRLVLRSLADHPEIRTAIAEQFREHFPRRRT